MTDYQPERGSTIGKTEVSELLSVLVGFAHLARTEIECDEGNQNYPNGEEDDCWPSVE